ncbi:hypothetical protein KKJ29_10445 [Xenorhabdus bovienii]|nr:hypothetical protein [Xenorhabdus bovienii]
MPDLAKSFKRLSLRADNKDLNINRHEFARQYKKLSLQLFCNLLMARMVGTLGEEFGLAGSETFESGWIIDSIDGTRAFIYDVPLFNTLIAYIENGEPVVGVIGFPVISTIVYVAQG